MVRYLCIGAALVACVAAECTRAVLESAAQAYLDAVTTGKPQSITGLSDNTSYVENDAVLDIGKGIFSAPISIDFNRSFSDTEECGTFIEIDAANNKKHPYVILTKIMLDAQAQGKSVQSIESIVTDAGDWAFNAAGHLQYARQEKWDLIPEAKRDTRAVIKAAGDAYLDSWGDGKVSVPYGTPCSRIEGGSSTAASGRATGNTCTMPQFPQPFKITKRKYLIDTDYGSLDILNEFPFIDRAKPDGTPSTNIFRVEGGKIRYIHELTVCTNRGCGR